MKLLAWLILRILLGNLITITPWELQLRINNDLDSNYVIISKTCHYLQEKDSSSEDTCRKVSPEKEEIINPLIYTTDLLKIDSNNGKNLK